MEMNVIICRVAFLKKDLLVLEYTILVIIHLIFECKIEAQTQMFGRSLSPSQKRSN